MIKLLATLLLCSLAMSTQAVLPEKDTLDWKLSDGHTERTLSREKISLNGVWKISLQSGKGLFTSRKMTKREEILQNLSGKKPEIIPQQTYQTEKTWKETRVPGLWYDVAWWSPILHESQVGRDKIKKPMLRACNRVKWLGKPLKNYHFAWYQREFKVPENWKIENSFIKFDQLSKECWVFINSQYIGHQTGVKSYDMPLPQNIKPGDTVKLDVLVSAFVAGEATIFLGGEQIFKTKKKSPARGITGDVWLLTRSDKKYIKDVFVSTSYRQKKLTLKVAFSEQPSGQLKGVIKTWKGQKTAKEFSLPIESGKKISETEYQFEIPWQYPTLWTPDNPFLYDLSLSWLNSDKQLVDQDYPIRFGFRELWISGRNYFLNGYPVRFRIGHINAMPRDRAEAELKIYKEMGLNTIELKTSYCDINEILDVADEMGILVFCMLPPVNSLVHTWQDPTTRQKWLKTLKMDFDKAKNHPSVVQWGMNFNLLGYAFDLEPHRLGTDYLPSKTSASASNWKVAKQSEEMLLELDSSRPVYHHAGGNYGQAHTSNMYLDFSPLQEKAEWPSIWQKEGIKPFMAIELGMPYIANYYRNRQSVGARNNFKSEPFYAEYTARLFGPEAFLMNTAERLRPVINSQVIPGALGDGSDFYKTMMGYHYGAIRKKPFPEFVRSQSFLGDFLKDWRTYGVSGFTPWYDKYTIWETLVPYTGKVAKHATLKSPGYKTLFEYKPSYKCRTKLYDSYVKWLVPQLFYISGSSNEFTDKTHAYWADAEVQKGIAWINDTFNTQKTTIKIDVTNVNGESVFTKEIQAQADPGQIQIIDFSFAAPKVKQKTDYQIKLTVNNELKDSFSIQVFPKTLLTKIATKRKIFLIDAAGTSGELLKSINIPFSKYNGEKLTASDLLIIGQESLNKAIPSAAKIADAVKKGLNVLILAQQAKELEGTFGLRTMEASARRVFKGQDQHAVYKNIENKDLDYWAGKSTMLEEFPKPEKNAYPHHIWKFGNKQIVSSVVIEKPHKGAYRSLLHEGFDLGYTPLLEEMAGQGKIVFCQLDLVNRTKENPVGDIMLHNIISYLDDNLESKRAFYYTGSKNGQNILDMTGIIYNKITDLSKLPQNAVLVIGDSKSVSRKRLEIMKNLGMDVGSNALKNDAAALKKFIENGGTVIILAANDLKKIETIFGMKVANAKMTDYRFASMEIPGLTTGIGGGDWYWKDNIDLPLPTAGFPIKAEKIGKGNLIICQVNPLYYNKHERHQRRQRSQRKMTRILATMFTNLNGKFQRSSLEQMTQLAGPQDINLEGKWNFKIDLNDEGLKKGWQQTAWATVEKQLDVPAGWEEQGINTPNPKVNGKLPYDGYAWYQKEIVIPENLEGKQLYLEMGTADDFDWAYFNGKEIGKTGPEHPKYWDTRRYYPIPAENIKYGVKNLVVIRIFDKFLGGGITKSPVRITFEKNRQIPYHDANVDKHLRFDPYHFHRW